MNKNEIQSSNTKLLLGIGSSILFVAVGFYLLTTLAEHQTRFNPIIVKGIGIGCVIFFGITAIYGIKKLLSNSNA